MFKWTSLVVMLGLFASGFFFSGCGKGEGDLIDTAAFPIAPAVNRLNVAEKYYNRKVQLKTRTFYRAHEYRRAWLGKRKPEKMFDAFVEEVKASERYGFRPADYHIDELEAAVDDLYENRDRTEADISGLDVRISASFFLFTTHLLEGRIRFPGARDFFWERGMPLENDIALLLKMESASDLRKELEALHPPIAGYKKLQEVLQKYRQVESADTLAPLPKRIGVKAGESHPVIPLIRKRLALANGQDVEDTSDVYDEALVTALKDFQLRHGLEADGIAGSETIRFLNISVKERADLIALNLERLRWRPHIKGEGDEIVINVPEYMLHLYRNNREQLNMRVVLGAEYTATPVFHDTLKYIVFSPTWIVPRSIFEEEFYPRLREDPEHFDVSRFQFFKEGKQIDPLEEDWDDKDFDISKFSMIENPGDANSLGKVKFIMPNDFSVYLHDTPADQLFDRKERALSHGCIRLENPVELAKYLLSGQKGWNEKKIRAAMDSGEPQRVDLEKVFPVYIVYRTVWLDDEDRVHFRDDVYGHDERHLASLN